MLVKILCFILLVQYSKSAIFENVRIGFREYIISKLYYDDHSPPVQQVVLKSSNSLNEIEKPSDVRLTAIEIVQQKIPLLNNNSISDLDFVEQLWLSSNQIKEIEEGSFRNLPNLVQIDLSKNLLEEIKKGVFNQLPIRILKLQDNRISKIEDGAFMDMNRLAHLELQNNNIKTLTSEWFGGTPQLGLVNLNNNTIEEIPSRAFQDFKKRGSTIFLSYNKIGSIHPEAFYGLKTLDWVSFSYNLLQAVPGDLFENITFISKLTFTGNKIYNFEDDFLGNTKVGKVFDAEDNFLSCIPIKFANTMDFAASLRVERNPFTCECIGDLKKWNTNNNNKIDLIYYNRVKCVNI